MEITVTKTISIIFKSKGRFRYEDGTRSMHDWGDVYNTETKEKVGIGLFTKTNIHRYSYSANQRDFDQVFRKGEKCNFLCFKNELSGKEFAVDKVRALQLAEIKGVFTNPKTGSTFYVFDEADITGKPEDTPY